MSERYTIARITCEGEHFEILVRPQPALDYTSGKNVALSEVLVTDTVFIDAKKGTRAGEDKLKAAFNITDTRKVAEIILNKGKLQLTTEQRRKLSLEKRRQIIAFIARHAVDPKTNLPHPIIRIEQAMEQIHYPIDAFKETEEQAKNIIKLLRPVLPLKVEQTKIEVLIPPAYAAKAYGTIKNYGAIKSEKWRADGSLLSTIEMPAGLYGPFLEKLGELTKGTAEAKRI